MRGRCERRQGVYPAPPLAASQWKTSQGAHNRRRAGEEARGASEIQVSRGQNPLPSPPFTATATRRNNPSGPCRTRERGTHPKTHWFRKLLGVIFPGVPRNVMSRTPPHSSPP